MFVGHDSFAAAEQLYDALYQWNKAGSISITSTSLPFFKQLVSSAAVGTYASSSSTYTTLTNAVKTYADGFVALAAQYTPSGGQLSEQYDKKTGAQESAVKLTWSFASAVTAFDARANSVPASWGGKGLTVPAQCASGGTGPTIAVTFNEVATTVLGENVYLTGSIPQLSSWSTTSALKLNNPNYPTWTITVNIPAGTTFQYKFVKINNGNGACSPGLQPRWCWENVRR